MQRIVSILRQGNDLDNVKDHPGMVRGANTTENPANNLDSVKDCPGDSKNLMEFFVKQS